MRRVSCAARAFRGSRRKRDLRHLRPRFACARAPNIEPSKTIKMRFMMNDKLSISTCTSPRPRKLFFSLFLSRTLAHTLRKYVSRGNAPLILREMKGREKKMEVCARAKDIKLAIYFQSSDSFRRNTFHTARARIHKVDIYIYIYRGIIYHRSRNARLKFFSPFFLLFPTVFSSRARNSNDLHA